MSRLRRPFIAALKRSGVAEMPTTAGMGGFAPVWPSMSLAYIVLFTASDVALLPRPRCASSMKRKRWMPGSSIVSLSTS